MIRALVEYAERRRREGELAPVGYKLFSRQKPIRWIIMIEPDGSIHKRGAEIEDRARPDRQRAGKPSPTNLKPYLLVDDARYALGIPIPGREDEAELLHSGFVDLLAEAVERTQNESFARILTTLRERSIPEDVLDGIEPTDIVTFEVGEDYPFESKDAREFWADYIERDFAADHEGTCCGCGRWGPVLQTLPQEVKVAGQKCQITSFNRTAFTSFGKRQTANASLCFRCATAASQAILGLMESDVHRVVVARDDAAGAGSNPLRNHVAVFWLREPVTVQLKGKKVDLETNLSDALSERRREGQEPKPRLSQLEALLNVPWTARESAGPKKGNALRLAVLSANKGRLVVREWMELGLDEVRTHLGTFLGALRIEDAWGDELRPVSVVSLYSALTTKSLTSGPAPADPNLIRGLLRTAYRGNPPPPDLINRALRRLRNPQTWNPEPRDLWRIHALLAAIKLGTTYRKGAVTDMSHANALERLDPGRSVPAYLSGRLLAVLEDAQQRASGWDLNTTIVDRFYTAAATAPRANLSLLLNRAQTSHLAKLRREYPGASRAIDEVLEEVLSDLDEAGGFPLTLTLQQQAEFALGFYHQRAAFRRARRERKEAKAKEPEDNPQVETESDE